MVDVNYTVARTSQSYYSIYNIAVMKMVFSKYLLSTKILMPIRRVESQGIEVWHYTHGFETSLSNLHFRVNMVWI